MYSGGVTGKTLLEKTLAAREKTVGKETVFYFEEPLETAPFLKDFLRPGDLFVTMGAGDNWKLGLSVFHYFNGDQL